MATKSKELTKLKRIFKDIPDDRREVCSKLIENAAFMAERLEELQEYLKEYGMTEAYKNGENQFGRKKSAEADVYNTMIKNYQSTIKLLLDQLPDKGSQADALMDFIKR